MLDLILNLNLNIFEDQRATDTLIVLTTISAMAVCGWLVDRFQK